MLHIFEIYGMRLNGHLAVLSACSTGSGKLQKGEGVISLARAFMMAGIPSIMMTLWDVEDLSSGYILPRFYYLYSHGFRKDEALRTAKINYLKSVNVEIEAHPVFWSGFVLYGNNKPYKESPWRLYYVLLVLLAGLFILISFLAMKNYIRFRKNNKIQSQAL